MILPNPRPKLVVLTGLPASGKSEAADWLREQHGYQVLSTDESRQRLFGKEYGDMRKTDDEETVRDTIDYAKRYHLAHGENVVIDTCAPTNKFRRRMLSLAEYLDNSIEKYLIHIHASNQAIRKRQQTRGRSPEAIETIEGFWQDPADEFHKGLFYEVENNQDLDEFYNKLNGVYQTSNSRI